MKAVLRMSAVVLVLACLGGWLLTGAHRGWTQTSVTIMRTDPVTDLNYPETKKQFVMGVDLLGGGLLLAAGLAGASFLGKS